MSNKSDLQELISQLSVLDTDNPTVYNDKFTAELTYKLNLAFQNNYDNSFSVGSVNFKVSRMDNTFTLNVQILNSNFTFSPRLSTGTTLDTDSVVSSVNTFLSGVFSGLGIPMTADKITALSAYVDSLPDEEV